MNINKPLTYESIIKAIEDMTKEGNQTKPKVLVYSKRMVKMVGGVDKCIDKIYELFGIKMKLEKECSGQYLFEEVRQS
jgi:hypothetical protein